MIELGRVLTENNSLSTYSHFDIPKSKLDQIESLRKIGFVRASKLYGLDTTLNALSLKTNQLNTQVESDRAFIYLYAENYINLHKSVLSFFVLKPPVSNIDYVIQTHIGDKYVDSSMSYVANSKRMLATLVSDFCLLSDVLDSTDLDSERILLVSFTHNRLAKLCNRFGVFTQEVSHKSQWYQYMNTQFGFTKPYLVASNLSDLQKNVVPQLKKISFS